MSTHLEEVVITTRYASTCRWLAAVAMALLVPGICFPLFIL